jgi:hypothetical protein
VERHAASADAARSRAARPGSACFRPACFRDAARSRFAYAESDQAARGDVSRLVLVCFRAVRPGASCARSACGDAPRAACAADVD